MDKSLDSLNQRYFGGQLSSEVLHLLADLSNEGDEVWGILERWCRFAHIARFRASDFSNRLASSFSLIRDIVPGAWGGIGELDFEGTDVARCVNVLV